MKKLFSIFLCLAIFIGMLTTSAFAETLVLPDMADLYPDDLTLEDIDEESRLRLYSCTDEETAALCIIQYAGTLMMDYDFDNLKYDEADDDDFYGTYMTTYNGSADLEPEYLNDMDVLCYLLFGITSYDGQVMIVVDSVEGISFEGDPVVEPAENDDALVLPTLDLIDSNASLMESEDGEVVNIFTYTSADMAAEGIINYLNLLCDEYSFSGLGYDGESSDVFVYVYLTDYNGTADIQPEYFLDCPIECYVMVAIGTYEGEVVTAIAAADGINFVKELEAVETDIVIPDLAEYAGSEFIFCGQVPEEKAVVYDCTDIEFAVNGVVSYAEMLCDEYGFENIEIDTESSDTAAYVYLTGYTGSADLEPEYLYDSPEPCYVVFCMIGYDSGAGVMTGFAAVDGITIGDGN